MSSGAVIKNLSQFEKNWQERILNLLGLSAEPYKCKARSPKSLEIMLGNLKGQYRVDLAYKKPSATIKKIETQINLLMDCQNALKEILERTITSVNDSIVRTNQHLARSGRTGEVRMPLQLLVNYLLSFKDKSTYVELSRGSAYFVASESMQKILEDLLKEPANHDYSVEFKEILFHYLDKALLPALNEYIDHRRAHRTWGMACREGLGIIPNRYRLRDFYVSVRDALRSEAELVWKMNAASIIASRVPSCDTPGVRSPLKIAVSKRGSMFSTDGSRPRTPHRTVSARSGGKSPQHHARKWSADSLATPAHVLRPSTIYHSASRLKIELAPTPK